MPSGRADLTRAWGGRSMPCSGSPRASGTARKPWNEPPSGWLNWPKFLGNPSWSIKPRGPSCSRRRPGLRQGTVLRRFRGARGRSLRRAE
eukprot:3011184-Alexandrium_andersonii.AAC.1